MRLVRIRTTAWEKEDFLIMTTLSDQDIVEVVNPIVMAERDGYEEYDNDLLVERLKARYPLEMVEMRIKCDELIF